MIRVEVQAVSVSFEDLQVAEQCQLIEHIGDLATASADALGEGLVVKFWAINEAALIGWSTDKMMIREHLSGLNDGAGDVSGGLFDVGDFAALEGIIDIDALSTHG